MISVVKADRHLRIGVSCSLLGHLLLVLFISQRVGGDFNPLKPPVVYSVTLEAGSKIGGLSQVPKSKEKAPVAPPKKVKTKVKASPPKKKTVVEKKAPPKDSKPQEKAEVSVASKKPPEPVKKKAIEPAKKRSVPEKSKPQPVKKVPAKKETVEDLDKRLQEAVQRYTGESTDAGGKGFGSRGGGSGSAMGGGVVRPPAFFIYSKTLEMAIKEGWRWHDTNSDLKARVCFRMNTQGVLAAVALCGSSGNRGFDESIIRAVHKANPVPAPPESVYSYFREVRMTFSARD